MIVKIIKRILALGIVLLLLSIVLVASGRWINPPTTALMLERQWQAYQQQQKLTIQHNWVDWSQLPDSLKLAVIAGEDQKFAYHHGFDMAAIKAALAHNQKGGSLRGGSTLSQQLAKNLFLWSGRSWPRKVLEAWFTAWIELLWSKERILEIYLNSVEWGPGIFGAQAAARYHFAVPVQQLNTTQSSLLAASLPNPLQWRASHPNAHIQQRAAWIRQQIKQLGGAQYLKRLQQPPN